MPTDIAEVRAAIRKATYGNERLTPQEIAALVHAAALYVNRRPPTPPATDAPYRFWLGKAWTDPDPVEVRRDLAPGELRRAPWSPFIAWDDWDPQANDVGVVAR